MRQSKAEHLVMGFDVVDCVSVNAKRMYRINGYFLGALAQRKLEFMRFGK